jgi:hypothetical protein
VKSIKKRFKGLLAEIEQLALELFLLSADLSLLEEMQALSTEVLQACEKLKLQTSNLNKTQFVAGISEAEGLIQLNELTDGDVISVLEQVFFAALENHADSAVGKLLQQLLEKLEKRYTLMIENIQQLSSLLDDE